MVSLMLSRIIGCPQGTFFKQQAKVSLSLFFLRRKRLARQQIGTTRHRCILRPSTNICCEAMLPTTCNDVGPSLFEGRFPPLAGLSRMQLKHRVSRVSSGGQISTNLRGQQVPRLKRHSSASVFGQWLCGARSAWDKEEVICFGGKSGTPLWYLLEGQFSQQTTSTTISTGVLSYAFSV